MYELKEQCKPFPILTVIHLEVIAFLGLRYIHSDSLTSCPFFVHYTDKNLKQDKSHLLSNTSLRILNKILLEQPTKMNNYFEGTKTII